MNRRDFLKSAAAAAAAGLAAPRLFAQAAPAQPAAAGSTVWVIKGKAIPAMLKRGIELAGGWGAFVKKDARVTLKPNAAWACTPAEGANTHPDLVRAFCLGAFEAGAKSVTLPEINASPKSFEISGILEALKDTQARLYKPEKESELRKVDIPKGVILKEAMVPVDILDCDCLVNMPVAKHHGAATVTLSMKNWMGSDKNRGKWHAKGLHQCIADFSTLVKPALVIIDATRIMTTNGPRGPGKLEYPDKIIIGRDPVACDAVAATLFGHKPLSIQYIKMAQDLGVGCGDLDQIKVVEEAV
jgi:uncharacterized protein (DUF362 family)